MSAALSSPAAILCASRGGAIDTGTTNLRTAVRDADFIVARVRIPVIEDEVDESKQSWRELLHLKVD